jgi:hypothetical protein
MAPPVAPDNALVVGDGTTVNEALCYIANKIDLLPQDILVKVCSDFYDEKVIEDAKVLLFQLCADTNESSQRCIRKQGQTKKEHNIEDICKLMNEAGEAAPRFVALDLSRLPPVTFDNIDVCVLLRDLQNSRVEMAMITEAMKEQQEINKTVTARLSRIEASGWPDVSAGRAMPLSQSSQSQNDRVNDRVTEKEGKDSFSMVVRRNRKGGQGDPERSENASTSAKKAMSIGMAKGTGLRVVPKKKRASIFVTGLHPDVEES